MKLISNYHVHSSMCDGKHTLEEMVVSSIEKGLKYLGLSGHAPLSYSNDYTMKEDKLDEYLNKIEELKIKYRDKIKIFTGLEIDYFYNIGLNPLGLNVMNRLDYYIGSIHGLELNEDGKTYWYVDSERLIMEKGINYSYNGDIKKAVSDYYSNLAYMAEKYRPPIIGHMDIIKKNNKDNYFFNENEPWYKDLIISFLERVKKTNCIIEINTGGIARYGKELLYPSPWIIKEIYNRNINITVNADSHSSDAVDFYYHEVDKLIKNIGFREIMILTEDGWVPYNIY